MNEVGELEVTFIKTVVVPGTDDKPALKLISENGEVRVELLPKQGQRRRPVKIEVLAQALRAISDQKALARPT